MRGMRACVSGAVRARHAADLSSADLSSVDLSSVGSSLNQVVAIVSAAGA
jgi:hypothetical protein